MYFLGLVLRVREALSETASEIEVSAEGGGGVAEDGERARTPTPDEEGARSPAIESGEGGVSTPARFAILSGARRVAHTGAGRRVARRPIEERLEGGRGGSGDVTDAPDGSRVMLELASPPPTFRCRIYPRYICVYAHVCVGTLGKCDVRRGPVQEVGSFLGALKRVS